MKNIFPTLFILFSFGITTSLEAQMNVLLKEVHTIEANINLINEQLSDLKSNGKSNMDLVNGELNISFPLKRNIKEEFYKVQLEVSLNGKTLSLMEENLSGSIGEKVVSDKEDLKNITWMQLIDTYQQLEGRLLIKVTTELWGKSSVFVDCDNPPVFGAKQKRPFYIAGGAGLVAIGAGQYFKSKSDKKYEDEYLTANSLEEAEPKYEEANSDHHTYLILTYAGSAILVTDIVWYLIQNGKHKKRMKVYKEFCNDKSMTISPLIEIPAGPSNNGATGIQFTFTF